MICMFTETDINTGITTPLEVSTPNDYTYQYLDDIGLHLASSGQMQFWVKTTNDAHISLTNERDADDTIEIVIGGWGNTKSVIRSFHQQSPAETEVEEAGLDGNDFKPYWITWSNGDISVGTGSVIGQDQFMTATIQQDIKYVGISTGWGASGVWVFGYGR